MITHSELVVLIEMIINKKHEIRNGRFTKDKLREVVFTRHGFRLSNDEIDVVCQALKLEWPKRRWTTTDKVELLLRIVQHICPNSLKGQLDEAMASAPSDEEEEWDA